MKRRSVALALLALLAFAGALASASERSGRACCRMGRACPMMASRGAVRCPVSAAWSVQLGCCAPAPAAPAPTVPTLAAPAEGSAAPAPLVATSRLASALPAAPLEAWARSERACAARLHDLGLFTLLSVLLI
ncbi:MAG: hypothetical protein IPJ17_21005 [Holophagales bacterium]|nr:MAG: hypothetical protein IPJ17_21005 [Holophagales bacterium]